MATVNDAPAEHRSLAERMPADVRERMDPAELRLRLAEVARLQAHMGDMPDAETARGMSQHAEAMLKALPYSELEERCRQLKRSATQAPTALDATGYVQAATELKRTNPQPAVMTQAAHLADAQHGLGHLAASANAEHRQLAIAAQMIRLQRAAIAQGTAPAAASTSTPARAGAARERPGSTDITKGGEVEQVPFLAKAAGAAPATRADVLKALGAEITKAVQDAYDAAGFGERLDRVAAEIRETRAEMAGRTNTMGAPITNTRSY